MPDYTSYSNKDLKKLTAKFKADKKIAQKRVQRIAPHLDKPGKGGIHKRVAKWGSKYVPLTRMSNVKATSDQAQRNIRYADKQIKKIWKVVRGRLLKKSIVATAGAAVAYKGYKLATGESDQSQLSNYLDQIQGEK